MAANENQTITSTIFIYLIQCHCDHLWNVPMKLVKINQNMSIEMHFDGQTACLILVQLHPPLYKMAATDFTDDEWKVFYLD